LAEAVDLFAEIVAVAFLRENLQKQAETDAPTATRELGTRLDLGRPGSDV
jgi:hypothetical protein